MSTNNLKTINLSSSEIGSVKFDSSSIELRNADSVAKSLAYVVGWQLARRRSGSAKTKLMSEISGTTAKPHKQKGTGSARQGSKRSVQFRGGRACFGPLPRSFDYSMPKKIIKKAVADVLKLKIKENKLVLFNGADNSNLKTTQINSLLKSNKIDSALFLYQNSEDNFSLSRSVKNIKNAKSLDFKAINAYDMLRFDFLILDEKLFGNVKEVIA